jgi:cytochrome c peroxidase
MQRYILGIVTLFILCIALQSTFFGCISKYENSVNADSSIVTLGKYLFFDRRLSVNNTRSCATCHNPQFAFTDGYKRSLGAFADLHQRNTQPLFNLSYFKYLTAADSTIHNLVLQMNNPLFNTHPVEMGVGLNEEKILKAIKEDSNYNNLFKKSFPAEKNTVNWLNIKIAISRFVLTIISNNSPYDKYKNGDSNALTISQKNGMQLFFSTNSKCSSCHGGFNFSTPNITGNNSDTLFYYNVGLYNINGKGAYPKYDEGLFALTKKDVDMGKFRVPSLRNLAFTAPYFHDGSSATLTDVLEVFCNGGRKIEQGVNAGNGIKNPFKHSLIKQLALSQKDKIDLINFLMSLSDATFISNPAFQNPFTDDETKKK